MSTRRAVWPALPGLTVNLRGRGFIVPFPSLRIRRQDMEGRATLAREGNDPAAAQLHVEQITLATLQRNYPTLTMRRLKALASSDQIGSIYGEVRREEALQIEVQRDRITLAERRVQQAAHRIFNRT